MPERIPGRNALNTAILRLCSQRKYWRPMSWMAYQNQPVTFFDSFRGVAKGHSRSLLPDEATQFQARSRRVPRLVFGEADKSACERVCCVAWTHTFEPEQTISSSGRRSSEQVFEAAARPADGQDDQNDRCRLSRNRTQNGLGIGDDNVSLDSSRDGKNSGIVSAETAASTREEIVHHRAHRDQRDVSVFSVLSVVICSARCAMYELRTSGADSTCWKPSCSACLPSSANSSGV